MNRSNTSGVGLSLVILSSACWGMSGIFITFISRGSDISAWGLAFWREVAAIVVLFTGLRLFRPDLLRVKRQDWIWLVLMGATGMGLLHGTWNMSVMLNGAAVATILQYNAPILVSIVAFFLWREPLSGRKIAAIVMAFAGTLLAAGIDWSAGMELTSQGFVAGLGTAVAFGAISLFGKKLSGDYHTWTILFYTFFFAALALLPLQIGRPLPQTISMSALFAFIGLLAVSTIGGYAIYTVGLQRLPASIAVIIATMEVPFSALFAYALLGQQVNVVQGVGGMLVVSGVILLSLPLRKVKFAD